MILQAGKCNFQFYRFDIYGRIHELMFAMLFYNRYGSPGAQTLRVATTYIHHNHNSQTLDNDIALLKLQGQAELKPGVCIICLPSRGSIPETGRRCTVTGYGYMGESKLSTCHTASVHKSELI